MNKPASVPESNYTLVAILVAPLIAASCLSLWGFVLTEGWATVLGWTLIFYFYALVATLVIGLPCFLFLRRIGLVRWWSSIASGVFAGSLVLLATDPNAAASRPNDFAVWGGIGGLSAFAFWIVRFVGQKKHLMSSLLDPIFGEIFFKKHGWSGRTAWLDGSRVSISLERDGAGPLDTDRASFEEFKDSFPSLVPEIRSALFALWRPEMNQPHWQGQAPLSQETLWHELELSLITLRSDGGVELLFVFRGEFWPDGMFNVEVKDSRVRALSLDD